MQTPRNRFFSRDFAILVLIAFANFTIHMLANNRYGFHRDELAMLDDARHLALGYVAYPPLAPFLARVSLEVFGSSLVGARVLAALTSSLIMVLAGLMVRVLGGSRLAQVVAALAAAITPIVASIGGRIDYVAFDFLWGVTLAYFILCLLKYDDPRLWLAIGAVIGLGMLTKYTMAFFAAGFAGGIVLTRARRYLTSPWLWGGAALALLIFLPNLIWQIRHDFISLDFLSTIHERDIARGRSENFLIDQFLISTNIFVIPLWVSGLYFYFFNSTGRRYRLLGWMYFISLGLFVIMQGRGYYLAPAYPMLFAGGAVAWEQWIAKLPVRSSRLVQGVTWGALAVGGVTCGAMALRIGPINSDLWDMAIEVNEGYVEEVGWDDLVDTVAAVYSSLPAEEQPRTVVLTGNYGEAGAINLYGAAHHLPEAISGINSYWLRGYGDLPPETFIVLGYPGQHLQTVLFEECDWMGRITNRYGVENEETTDYPDIFVCRKPRQPWSELWKGLKHFG